MNLVQDDWFGNFGRNTRGYTQIHERLFFINNSELTQEERRYELSVLDKLVSMIPNESSREIYEARVKDGK